MITTKDTKDTKVTDLYGLLVYLGVLGVLCGDVNAPQAGTLPISLSTSLAALNASRPAGIPQ